MARYKEPELFGGQGVAASPRLCLDCRHRPVKYAHKPRHPSTPACTHSNAVIEGVTADPLAARDLCKGEFWAAPRLPSDFGAREV